jgi:hypothetical protein
VTALAIPIFCATFRFGFIALSNVRFYKRDNLLCGSAGSD